MSVVDQVLICLIFVILGVASTLALYFSHLSFRFGGSLGLLLGAKVVKRLDQNQGPRHKVLKGTIEVCLVMFESGEKGLGIAIWDILSEENGLTFRREQSLEWIAGLRVVLEESEAVERPRRGLEVAEAGALKSAWRSLDDIVSGPDRLDLPGKSHFGWPVDRLLLGVMRSPGQTSSSCIRLFQLDSSESRLFGMDFCERIFSSRGSQAIVLTEEQLREHLRKIESLGLESL